MPGHDLTTFPSKRSRKGQLSPLVISPNHAIVLQPATPTTPRNTPPATPIINSALLSPPSLKRRSSFRTERSASPPPLRPASAPPKLVSLEYPSSPFTSGNPPPWYFSRNSLAARRAGRTVTVPPPPLGQIFVPIHLSIISDPSAVRPTTFWRRANKSGVSDPSYSPSFHLIRRSAFIAAGLDLDKPSVDISAFSVESRTLRANLVVIPRFTHDVFG